MRRPSLALVFLALVLTMAVSVMAFRQTQVTNGASITIVSTDVAALAVQPVDTNYASYVNNQVSLSFPNQQPNSNYTYNNVFKVQNLTPATITFDIPSVTGEAVPGAHLTITDASNGTVYWQGGASTGTRSLTSMAEVTLHVKITLDAGTTIDAPRNLSITVRGR